MTAPTFNQQGTGTTSNTSSTVNVAFPASGLLAGDVGIILGASYSNGSTAYTWNGIWNAIQATSNGTGTCSVAGAYGRLDGTETGNATYTHSTGALTRMAVMAVFRGCVASGSPVEGASITGGNGNGTSATFPTVVTTDVDRLIVGICSARNTTANSAYTNFTERGTPITNTSRKLFLATCAAPTAGSYTGDTFTIGASAVDWAAVSFALIPAAGSSISFVGFVGRFGFPFTGKL